MQARKEFLRIAQDWVDAQVPWRKVGSTREGANCLGFPVGVARELGGFEELVALGEVLAMFTRPLTPRMMVDGMNNRMAPIRLDKAIPGDLLLFRVTDRPDHISILANLNPKEILHSDRPSKLIQRRCLIGAWIPTMAFRIREFGE